MSLLGAAAHQPRMSVVHSGSTAAMTRWKSGTITSTNPATGELIRAIASIGAPIGAATPSTISTLFPTASRRKTMNAHAAHKRCKGERPIARADDGLRYNVPNEVSRWRNQR